LSNQGGGTGNCQRSSEAVLHRCPGDAGTGDAEVKAAAREAHSSPHIAGSSEQCRLPYFPWAP